MSFLKVYLCLIEDSLLNKYDFITGFTIPCSTLVIMNIRKPNIKIWDSFLYAGEEEILEYRLSRLDRFCDHFVVVECAYTHSGRERIVSDSNFRKSLEDRFPQKITWLILTDIQHFDTAWERESWQRNQIHLAIQDASLDDIILLSDVDEIPNDLFFESIMNLMPSEICVSQMNLYFYDVHFRSKRSWFGTIATKVNPDLDFQELRNRAISSWNLNANEIVRNSGSHFSSIGGSGNLSSKIKSFTHTEFNTWPFNRPLFLQILISLGICFDGSEVLRYEISNNSFQIQMCRRSHRADLIRILIAKIFCPVVKLLYKKFVGELSSGRANNNETSR